MAHPGQEILIKDALVFLMAAGLVVPLLNKLKIPTVTGFILTGVMLGVSGIGLYAESFPLIDYFTISDPDRVAPFAELGVLFLLFLLGLEMSVEKLWALRRIVLGAGLVQVSLCAIIIAVTAMLFGLSAPVAWLIGLALALSSTAIVMQLLVDSRQLSAPIGKTSLGVLLLQDVLVAPILIFVAFVGASSTNTNLTSELLIALVEGVVALAVIIFLGRFVVRPVFHQAANGGRGHLMAVILLMILGAAVITASAGLSVALGAFLAGLLLGETEFKHQAELDLEPFKGLLLGLFFMTVGLTLDLRVIGENWTIVAAGVVGLVLIKAIIIWFAVRIFVGGRKLPWEAAFLLASAGEFAFVVLAAGSANGAIENETATLVAAIAALTMLFIPALWQLGKQLGATFVSRDTAHKIPDDKITIQDHIIIIGFGRVGQATARLLDETDASTVALDTKPATVRDQRQKGISIYLGDGAREEALLKAGLKTASMMIITVDDPKSTEIIVKTCHKIRPDLPIFARAQDVDHAQDLYQAGAHFVVPDAIEAGLQMSARALEEIGYDAQTVRDIIATERANEYKKATRSD
jgi:CPA2 family monovalent cation:H+ antiporter-2